MDQIRDIVPAHERAPLLVPDVSQQGCADQRVCIKRKKVFRRLARQPSR